MAVARSYRPEPATGIVEVDQLQVPPVVQHILAQTIRVDQSEIRPFPAPDRPARPAPSSAPPRSSPVSSSVKAGFSQNGPQSGRSPRYPSASQRGRSSVAGRSKAIRQVVHPPDQRANLRISASCPSHPVQRSLCSPDRFARQPPHHADDPVTSKRRQTPPSVRTASGTARPASASACHPGQFSPRSRLRVWYPGRCSRSAARDPVPQPSRRYTAFSRPSPAGARRSPTRPNAAGQRRILRIVLRSHAGTVARTSASVSTA